MKILELFSGTESFSKVARERGHECLTVDNNPLFDADLTMDILKFDAKKCNPSSIMFRDNQTYRIRRRK